MLSASANVLTPSSDHNNCFGVPRTVLKTYLVNLTMLNRTKEEKLITTIVKYLEG